VAEDGTEKSALDAYPTRPFFREKELKNARFRHKSVQKYYFFLVLPNILG